MNISQGIDIVDVNRMKQAIERRGRRFLKRIFTEQEISYCESKKMKYEHYAARFAAKEAVMKAAEVRRKNYYQFREIEVTRLATGKPKIHMSKTSLKRFGIAKKHKFELSMAHERDFAIASVLLITS